MLYVPDDKEMKKIEKITIEDIKIPSMVLMERAALSVAVEVEHRLDTASSVLCVCGCGNNGADGLAVARILILKGYTAHVWIPVHSHTTKEWNLQFEIIQNLGICVVESPCLGEYTVIVDAIFGIGCHRELEGSHKHAVLMLNQSKAHIVAVDIPSGIHADTGKVCGVAVKAHTTITFGFIKRGMICYPGAEFAGNICVSDIGFPDIAVNHAGVRSFTYERRDLEKIPRRKADSHKGTFGKVLVCAGSKNMCGAAYFAAKAAYCMGAGLVTIFTCEENREILQMRLPEAILITYEAGDSESKSFPLEQSFLSALERADVLVIGPGLSTGTEAECLVHTALQYTAEHREFHAVFDADALNIISRKSSYQTHLVKNMVLTPHLGELARLMKESVSTIKEDLFDYARKAASEWDVVCVLKDSRTMVSCKEENQIYINTSGNEGMACAGSGDVLAGIIGGLLLMFENPFEAATMGVYLHGLAGDAAKEKYSSYSMGAADILTMLPELLQFTGKPAIHSLH